MGMACERIPLRYGVRSDHLLCSLLFISSCIGTLEIIGILIHIFYGEMLKSATVCVNARTFRIGSHEGKLSFSWPFPCFATEGQYKDRQPQQH